jgi:hypothetical protein
LAKIRGKRGSVQVHPAAATGTATASASAEATIIPTGGSTGEKVDWLMKEILKVEERLGQTTRDLRTETSERKTSDANETRTREAEISDVRDHIEGLAGHVLWISAIGVGLLVVGQFITAFWG